MSLIVTYLAVAVAVAVAVALEVESVPLALALALYSSILPTMVWHAKPGCPAHRRAPLERAVNALPTEWLETPRTGEVFDGIIECERRLRGYILAEGFDIVRNGSSTKKHLGRRFFYIFYRTETRNNWGLEDYIERDEKGMIISKR